MIYKRSKNGGVAQLGERTVRIRKVESSILFVSTMKKAVAYATAFFNDVFRSAERDVPVGVGRCDIHNRQGQAPALHARRKTILNS